MKPTPRVAWITGGGTGIGRALAEALYREGYRVAISGRRAEPLISAVQEISATKGPGEIWAVTCDVSNPQQVSQTHHSIQSKWGEVDLLINNAGINLNHSFADTSSDEFSYTFQTNCLSAVLCIKAVLPGMQARQTGAIVNVSSIYGRTPSATSPAYTVSKYALTGLTEALRSGLARDGVHLMGVYPGFIVTPMTMPFVRPGSFRYRMGRSPESLATEILKGLKHKKRNIYFPWYVPWAWRINQWFPTLLEKVRLYITR